MRTLTLRQLRIVEAIHRCGKIVNAGKALGLTGPAVTLQLKQVEEAVGMELFERASSGLYATDAGRAFVKASRAVDERLRALSDELDAIKGVRRGSLIVGAVSTAKYFAPRIIAGFMKAFPGVELKLLVGNRAQTIAKLEENALDIALMGSPPPGVPVEAQAFGDHPLLIVSEPGHPLAAARAISKQRIAAEHFIIRERGSGTRASFERFFGEIPGRLDDPGTEMDSNETIKQAVMAGLGIAFISAHTVASEVAERRLTVLDVVGLPIRRQWFSVMRSDRTLTPAMAAFCGFLAEQGAAFLPVLAGRAAEVERAGRAASRAPRSPAPARRRAAGAPRSL